MKTSSTQTKTSKKRSSGDADHAMKIAFQQLLDRAREEGEAARMKRRAEKYKQWQGAAKRFKGLSEALRLTIESRNIQAKEDGYLVNFTRGGRPFRRLFRGLGDESLSTAIKFRDEAEKILGETRKPIPSHILKAFGLSAPVPGIRRDTTDAAYVVSHEDAKRVGMPAIFPFDLLKEEDAYAAAIEFAEASLKSK
jgi:hypothetical protein